MQLMKCIVLAKNVSCTMIDLTLYHPSLSFSGKCDSLLVHAYFSLMYVLLKPQDTHPSPIPLEQHEVSLQ